MTLSRDTIKALPKVLLHEHLDGVLRPATILELARDVRYTKLPAAEPAALTAWFHRGESKGSLVKYLEGFAHTIAVMQTEEALERVAYEEVEDLANDGVVYFETRFAPVFHTRKGLTHQQVVAAVLKGLERGQLNISVVSTANYFMPQLLAKFCKRHPGINVILNVANRDTVLQQLAENATDLAVMGQPPESADIVAESFMKNPLVVIAPPGHPLCLEKHIQLKRLEQENFLLREQGSGTRGAMERFFAGHNVRFRAGMEMGTNEAIKQAVQAGMGLGILSLHSAELELETGRLAVLDVEYFPIVRHWYIAQRKSKRLSGAAQAFKQFLLNEAERLAAPVATKVRQARPHTRK